VCVNGSYEILCIEKSVIFVQTKYIMPTVKAKGKKDKVFPYTAVGKAQANLYAKMHGGKVKNNPGYGMEKSY